MDTILANMTVSVTELKRNFSGILKDAGERPVAVLNHNRAEAYLLPAACYERLLTQIQNLEAAKSIRRDA